MQLETKLGDLSTAIARTIHDTFKREIRIKLKAVAEQVVEEVAEEIAKDLTMKVDHMVSMDGDNFGPSVNVLLRINEKEKKYVVEKTVTEQLVPKR